MRVTSTRPGNCSSPNRLACASVPQCTPRVCQRDSMLAPVRKDGACAFSLSLLSPRPRFSRPEPERPQLHICRLFRAVT